MPPGCQSGYKAASSLLSPRIIICRLRAERRVGCPHPRPWAQPVGDKRIDAEMTPIHAKRALLPDGWARNVIVTIEDGRIASVITEGAGAPRTSAGAGTAISADILLPAPANLHSHSFQRAMAGMAESRGPYGHD